VDKGGIGAVFSEFFGFPCQFSFLRLFYNHHLSSGDSIIGQIVADVPSGHSLTPSQDNLKKLNVKMRRALPRNVGKHLRRHSYVNDILRSHDFVLDLRAAVLSAG
jgi:hypothetical protein